MPHAKICQRQKEFDFLDVPSLKISFPLNGKFAKVWNQFHIFMFS